MTRDDGPGGHGPPGRRPDADDELDEGANDLDATLLDAFRQAFVEDPPVDVGARHLWQLYRCAGRVGVWERDRYAEQGRMRRVVVSATLSIVVLVFPGLLGQLSLDALPGDLLYPVKRHNETVALSTAVSWEDRDQMLVDQAERRLTEAHAVATLRPSEVLPAVNDVGAIMDELQRSPVAATQAQVELIRGDVGRRLAALADALSEPASNEIRVAVDEIVTADARPSPTTAAAKVATTATASEGQSKADDPVAMSPQDDPPADSPDVDRSAFVSSRTPGTPTGSPSSTPKSPADAAVAAPTDPSEVEMSRPEVPPSATTPSSDPANTEADDCVSATTATVPGDAPAPQGSATASARAEPAAATADVAGQADQLALSEADADPESSADPCADTPPPGESPADLQPQGSPTDDAVPDDTAAATDEDTDMPQTTVDGESVRPKTEQPPDPAATSARPPDDEPLPAPVPRPGRTTSEPGPAAAASADDGATHAELEPTQPAQSGASTAP